MKPIVTTSLIAVLALRAIADDKASILTAQCRAQCLNKFYITGLSDHCLDNKECDMCWDNCEMLYKNGDVFGPMCDDEAVCFPGCQEACTFHRSHSDIIESLPRKPNAMTRFVHSYDQDLDIIRFEWSAPQSFEREKEALVYMMRLQDEFTNSWEQVEQSFYKNMTVRRSLLKTCSKIELTAFDAEGKISQIEKPCSEFGLDATDDGDMDQMLRDNFNVSTERPIIIRYVFNRQHISLLALGLALMGGFIAIGLIIVRLIGKGIGMEETFRRDVLDAVNSEMAIVKVPCANCASMPPAYQNA